MLSFAVDRLLMYGEDRPGWRGGPTDTGLDRPIAIGECGGDLDRDLVQARRAGGEGSPIDRCRCVVDTDGGSGCSCVPAAARDCHAAGGGRNGGAKSSAP